MAERVVLGRRFPLCGAFVEVPWATRDGRVYTLTQEAHVPKLIVGRRVGRGVTLNLGGYRLLVVARLTVRRRSAVRTGCARG